MLWFRWQCKKPNTTTAINQYITQYKIHSRKQATKTISYKDFSNASVCDVILHTPAKLPSGKCPFRAEDEMLYLSQFIINLYRHMNVVCRLSELHRIQEWGFPHVTASNRGTRWRRCLRYWATNRKVAASIPDGVSIVFIDIIISFIIWLWGRLSLYQKWVPGIFPAVYVAVV
jgi:hypothetical protein